MRADSYEGRLESKPSYSTADKNHSAYNRRGTNTKDSIPMSTTSSVATDDDKSSVGSLSGPSNAIMGNQ